MEIPAEKFPLLKKYLSWQLMLEKNLVVCQEKESCHQGFGITNSYQNQITHTPPPPRHLSLKSQMVDPLPKKCPRRKPFDFRAGFGVIESACKTKENLLKGRARLANLFCFKGQALELLVPKIRTRGSFYLTAICLGNSKTISKLNFEGLSTDSCSDNFSEIYLA